MVFPRSWETPYATCLAAAIPVSSAHTTRSALGSRSLPLHCLIESARGVEAAFEIASADPNVASIALGEADLRSDLGVTGEEGLLWARSRIVVAARAADLPAPAMSVYAQIDDLDGLAASCRRGRALGFIGRAAIHPKQLRVIAECFMPTEAEASAARELLPLRRLHRGSRRDHRSALSGRARRPRRSFDGRDDRDALCGRVSRKRRSARKPRGAGRSVTRVTPPTRPSAAAASPIASTCT